MRKFFSVLLLALGLTGIQTSAQEFDLSTYKGKVVYMDFWASWCGPCRQSFPWMSQLQEKYKSQGLVVIGVNVDQEQKLADKFIKELTPSFNIVFDPEGKLATGYQVAGMPSAFIVDRSGKVRFKHIGFHQDKTSQYEQEITTLLNEKP